MSEPIAEVEKNFTYHAPKPGQPDDWRHARIPIDTTNASDELAVAADMLADVGLDVASEVLRKEAERIVRWNEIEMGIYEHSDETPNNQRSR